MTREYEDELSEQQSEFRDWTPPASTLTRVDRMAILALSAPMYLMPFILTALSALGVL